MPSGELLGGVFFIHSLLFGVCFRGQSQSFALKIEIGSEQILLFKSEEHVSVHVIGDLYVSMSETVLEDFRRHSAFYTPCGVGMTERVKGDSFAVDLRQNIVFLEYLRECVFTGVKTLPF